MQLTASAGLEVDWIPGTLLVSESTVLLKNFSWTDDFENLQTILFSTKKIMFFLQVFASKNHDFIMIFSFFYGFRKT